MRTDILASIVLALGGCSMNADEGSLDANAIFSDEEVVIRLVEAACSGQVSDVDHLVKSGVDLNFVGEEGFTPLLFALHCGNLAGLKALIQGGANVNQVSNEKYSPAILAATLKDTSFLDVILDSGADIYKVPSMGQYNMIGSAFNAGAFNQNWSAYDLLLSKGVDLNRFIDKDERYDLATFAVTMNRYDRVLELLNMGYDRDLGYLSELVESGQIPGDPDLAEARVLVQKKIATLRAALSEQRS